MRLIRVFTDSALARGARVSIGGAAAEHVTRVLRLGTGDPVTLFNGDGMDYPSRISGLRRGSVEVDVEATVTARAESPLALTLVLGIARSERMDLVVQKATELGVAAIQPVVMTRSVVKLDAETRAKKLAHWRGIAIAACEQSGRARLPAIGEPLTLARWLGLPAPAGALCLLLAPDAERSLVATAAGARSALVLVGPEGGLEVSERDAALAVGYLPCRLGPRVLRSETAAVAALSVLQAVAGDLN